MPFLSPSRLGDRLAQRDADIFHRVVRVDVQVALGVDVEVDHAVPRDLVQHVLEERQAGIDADLPVPSRFTETVIWVSLVMRATSARRPDADLPRGERDFVRLEDFTRKP